MTYTKTGPFVDGGAPYLSAALFTSIDNELAAGRVANVRAYGAKGDGTTLDTAAFAAAAATGLPIYVPNGTYLVGAFTMTGGTIFGDGWGSQLLAAAGTGTILTAHQVAGFRVSNLWFNGNGNAATCIDTAWTIPTGQAAPSLNNRYDYVRVSGYTAVGWIATSNNDSPFSNILIEKSGTNTALNLQAAGGAVAINDCRVYGPTQLICQQANINGSVMSGIRIMGSDYNLINGNGGYWYTDPAYNANIYVASGAVIQSPSVLTGVHMENNVNAGAFLGGPGKVQGTAIWTGCHIFATGGASGLTLVDTALSTPYGINAGVRLVGGLVENVAADTTTNTNLTVTTDDFRYLANARGAGKRTVQVAQGATVTIPYIPRAGIALLRITGGTGPWTICAYGRAGINPTAGTVNVLSSASGITFAIPGSANSDVDTTDATVSHTITSTVTIEIVIVAF